MFRARAIGGPGPVGGHPVLAVATGAMIGSRMAANKAEAQQQQAQQQAQQAALDQANRNAAAAQEAARQAAQPQPHVQAYAYASPEQANAPAYHTSEPAAYSQSTTLGVGGPSIEDLVAQKEQLTAVLMMCDKALGLYQQSLELNKRAQRTNMGGAILDRGIRGRNGLDFAMDAKRDAETKASTVPAEQASAMLAQGFATIPESLRARYPTEMQRVGKVPVTELAVGSFGRTLLMGAAFGQRGENLNDMMMAKRISENEADLRRCIHVVGEQKNLMAIVLAHLNQDIANLQRTQALQRSMPASVQAQVVSPLPPPAIAAQPPKTMVELTSPHIVDEFNPSMQQHQIISVPAGAQVNLIKGTLQGGLGAPYNDYVEVEYNGRVGKISRLIVRPIGPAAQCPSA